MGGLLQEDMCHECDWPAKKKEPLYG